MVNQEQKILAAIAQLKDSVGELSQLLEQVKSGKEPDRVEIAALAYMMETFYTWVENVFRQLLQHGGSSNQWHRELLDNANKVQSNGKKIISDDLHEDLEEYLAFRHFVKYASCAILEWNEMRGPVCKCQKVLK